MEESDLKKKKKLCKENKVIVCWGDIWEKKKSPKTISLSLDLFLLSGVLNLKTFNNMKNVRHVMSKFYIHLRNQAKLTRIEYKTKQVLFKTFVCIYYMLLFYF